MRGVDVDRGSASFRVSERLRAPDLAGCTLAELMSLSGKVAVVTGGAAGIGLASCARLSEAGAGVVVADVRQQAAAAAALELGATATARHVDAGDPASLGELAAATNEQFGRLDIWVNAAGIYPSAPALEMDGAAWDEVLDVNLRGVLRSAKCSSDEVALGRPV